MKTYFYLLTVLILCSCQAQENKKEKTLAQTEVQETPKDIVKKDSIKIKLEEVYFENYCGKTLGELLENDTLKNYDDYYFIDEPPLKLSIVVFTYSNADKKLFFYVGEMEHQKQVNTEWNWSFELLKKEKVEYIGVTEKDWGTRPTFTWDCRF